MADHTDLLAQARRIIETGDHYKLPFPAMLEGLDAALREEAAENDTLRRRLDAIRQTADDFDSAGLFTGSSVAMVLRSLLDAADTEATDG